MKHAVLFGVLICVGCAANTQPGWVGFLQDVFPSVSSTKLSETTIGQGLREALSIGIDKAVSAASQRGGYLENEAIRIRFPEQLSVIETGLRTVGMGAAFDEFEQSVNRAAEAAAPQAKEILLNALFDLSIDDARKLLRGGETAATDYFRTRSWGELHQAFRPYLKKTMERYRASEIYNQLIAAYQKIPFAQKPALVSADEYATDKALEGLFYLVAEQEKKIRTDPAARVTDLLRSVFGS